MIFNNTLFVFLMLLVASGYSIAAETICVDGTTTFGVSYTTDWQLSGHEKEPARIHNHETNKKTVDLEFFAKTGKVAYLLPEKNVAEVWIKQPKNQLVFLRAFPDENRGIEYTYGDLLSLNVNLQWEHVERPFLPLQIAKLELLDESVDQCGKLETRKGIVNGQETIITWYPELGVVKYRLVNDKNFRVETRLSGWKNKAESLASFDKITAMPTMDFADIGDNEADSFVAKMIRQGFVAHVHADGNVSYPGGHQH